MGNCSGRPSIEASRNPTRCIGRVPKIEINKPLFCSFKSEHVSIENRTPQSNLVSSSSLTRPGIEPADSADSFEAVPSPDPKISANLQADYNALKNDLEQARNLAADYQQQLAGKTNDCAQMKLLLEKSAADLDHLRRDILELRQERHRLANEIVRIPILEHRLKKMTDERDHLRTDLNALWAQAAAAAQAGKESEPPADQSGGPLKGNDRILAKRLIADLTASIEDLKRLLEPSSASKSADRVDSDRIVEVSFGG